MCSKKAGHIASVIAFSWWDISDFDGDMIFVEMMFLALPLTLMHFNLAYVTRVCNDVTGTTSDW